MLNDPGAAKRIVEESAGEDRLSPFDRAIVGSNSVRIDFPLQDPVVCYRHLELMEDTCRAIRQNLRLADKKDRSQLFMVRGMLRRLNHQLLLAPLDVVAEDYMFRECANMADQEFEALVDRIVAAGHTLQTVLARLDARLAGTPPGPGRDNLMEFRQQLVDEIEQRRNPPGVR